MNRFRAILRSTVVVLSVAAAAPSSEAQEPPEKFTNLQVLPKDIAPEDLRKLMSSFTRGLGVRCTHCHVGEEGKPVKREDFAKDEKPAKLKAREMIRMTNDLNEKYLANLAHREDPPIRVQCITCHHGVKEPRPLQDLLTAAYEKGGIDSTVASYHALRERYYGSFAYDFSEMPLIDLASTVRGAGHLADAERLLALDVEMNPKASGAKRQHANVVLVQAFTAGADSGAAAYRNYKERYGKEMINEGFLNRVGYDLLELDRKEAAIAAFEFNVAENPTSANAYDSMGEAYRKTGNRKKAIAAYRKSLELDPANENAVKMLTELKAKPKSSKKK